MNIIWNIKLVLLKDGRYRVTIFGEGGEAKGFGKNAHDAYYNAECKLSPKPAIIFMDPGKTYPRELFP